MRHNTPIITVILLSFLSLAVFSLTGCDPQSSKPVADTSAPAADAHAKELYQAGDFYAAAEEYLALAKSDPSNEIKYQLGAVDALIKNQEIDRAQLLIDFLPPEKLTDVQGILKTIYQAQILLTQDNTEAASAMLNIDLPSETSSTVLAKFHVTRATILQSK